MRTPCNVQYWSFMSTNQWMISSNSSNLNNHFIYYYNISIFLFVEIYLNILHTYAYKVSFNKKINNKKTSYFVMWQHNKCSTTSWLYNDCQKFGIYGTKCRIPTTFGHSDIVITLLTFQSLSIHMTKLWASYNPERHFYLEVKRRRKLLLCDDQFFLFLIFFLFVRFARSVFISGYLSYFFFFFSFWYMKCGYERLYFANSLYWV